MLPVPTAPRTGWAAVHPASVRMRYVRPSVATSTSPLRSVRKVFRPVTDASDDRVSGAGCPYSLPSPDEMMAIDGRSAASSAGVVDEVEP